MSSHQESVPRATKHRVARVAAVATALAVLGGGLATAAHASKPATGGSRHNLYIKASPGVGSILFEVGIPREASSKYSRCYDTQGSDWQPTDFKVDNEATIVATTYDVAGCPADPKSLRGRSNPRIAPGIDGSADWSWDLTTSF
jgi:hypothetical protein